MSTNSQITVHNTAGLFSYQYTPGTSQIQNIRSIMSVWSMRASSRKALRSMQPHMLDDIGVSRTQAIAESKKHFWVE